MGRGDLELRVQKVEAGFHVRHQSRGGCASRKEQGFMAKSLHRRRLPVSCGGYWSIGRVYDVIYPMPGLKRQGIIDGTESGGTNKHVHITNTPTGTRTLVALLLCYRQHLMHQATYNMTQIAQITQITQITEITQRAQAIPTLNHRTKLPPTTTGNTPCLSTPPPLPSPQAHDHTHTSSQTPR